MSVKGNILRYLAAPNGEPIVGDATLDAAVRLSFVDNGIVQDNLVDLAKPLPLLGYRCNKVVYFNNRTTSGALVRGAIDQRNPNVHVPQNELCTVIADSATLGFL